MWERPTDFRLKPNHTLSTDLLAAFLGQHPGAETAFDSSVFGRHGTWNNYAASQATVLAGHGRPAMLLNGTSQDMTISLPAVTGGWTFAVLADHTKATSVGLFADNSTYTEYVRINTSLGRIYLKAENVNQYRDFGDAADVQGVRLFSMRADGVNMRAGVDATFMERSHAGVLDATKITTLGRHGGDRFGGDWSDTFFWDRWLDDDELAMITADPTYDGWIQPISRQKYWIFGSGAAPAAHVPTCHFYGSLVGSLGGPV